MLTFNELYKKLVADTLENGEGLSGLNDHQYDAGHLDCLLNPAKHAPVINIGQCGCDGECENPSCITSCMFDAIVKDEKGNYRIDSEKCCGCEKCIEACGRQSLIAGKDIIPTLNLLQKPERLTYALIAPSFLGQFSQNVTPGKLRSAFKKLGFSGMIEVALFADILTLKEALEFDQNIVTENDFQLTSCCCPMWIALIKKIYNQLMPHVPASVSPMVAAGRAIKLLYPDAATVFIGPCMAKKAEAREPDIADAIDYVLTFQEVRDVFEFAKIDPEQCQEDEKDNSSKTGRIYAYAGGVSEAVKHTVERLNPDRKITIKTRTADGIPACREMINEIVEQIKANEAVQNGEALSEAKEKQFDKIRANFYEGMGCKGGCVGGPKVIIPAAEAKKNVLAYGDAAQYETPGENPYVIELLKRLGFETVESLLEESDIFSRNWESR